MKVRVESALLQGEHRGVEGKKRGSKCEHRGSRASIGVEVREQGVEGKNRGSRARTRGRGRGQGVERSPLITNKFLQFSRFYHIP